MIKIIPKFRAWDSEANIMIYSDHRTRKLYDVYYGFEMNEKGELECRWEGDFTESHVLDGGILDNIMQYTGLKDKNGVEIYEGDIVYWESAIMNKSQWQGVVKFIGAGFCVQTSGSSRNTPDWLYAAARDEIIEIVGNIYENPELLEK